MLMFSSFANFILVNINNCLHTNRHLVIIKFDLHSGGFEKLSFKVFCIPYTL